MSLWSELVSKHSYTGVTSGKVAYGIPTINRKDLLTECVADLSNNFEVSKFKRLIIVDNGRQGIEEIIPTSIADKTTIYIEESNLGVAGSWNKIMSTAFDEMGCEFACLVNDDIVLGESFFKAHQGALDNNPDAFMINGPYF